MKKNHDQYFFSKIEKYASQKVKVCLPPGKWRVRISPQNLPSVESSEFEILQGEKTNVRVRLFEGGEIKIVCKDESGSFRSGLNLVACPVRGVYKGTEYEKAILVDELEVKKDSSYLVAVPLNGRTDSFGEFTFRPVPLDVWYCVYFEKPKSVRVIFPKTPRLFVKANGKKIEIVVRDLPKLILNIKSDELKIDDNFHSYVSLIVDREGSVIQRIHSSYGATSVLPIPIPNKTIGILNKKYYYNLKIIVAGPGGYSGEKSVSIPVDLDTVRESVSLEKYIIYELGSIPFDIGYLSSMWILKGKFLVYKNVVNEIPCFYDNPSLFVLMESDQNMKSYQLISSSPFLEKIVVWSKSFKKLYLFDFDVGRASAKTKRKKIFGNSSEIDIVIENWNVLKDKYEVHFNQIKRIHCVKFIFRSEDRR